MPRNLAFAPGRQVLVKVLQHRGGLFIERGSLFFDVHLVVGPRHRAQLFCLALDLGKWLFEVEVALHERHPSRSAAIYGRPRRQGQDQGARAVRRLMVAGTAAPVAVA